AGGGPAVTFHEGLNFAAEAFVEGAGGGPAVADVHQPHARLAPQLERQRDAGHDGDHVPQVRDLAEEASLEVVEVDVELAPAGRTPRLGHVLAQDLQGLRANTWRSEEHTSELQSR